jgi:effector-binding domain-containing protein
MRKHRPVAIAAVLHITVPRQEIQKVMAPGLEELKRAIGEDAVSAAGPWFTHHLRTDPEVFDFEIGIPGAAPVTPRGRVRMGELPATTVARTVFCGDYSGLGRAWGELGSWITEQGQMPGPDFWEVYLVGPESTSETSEWRTELNRPLLMSSDKDGVRT